MSPFQLSQSAKSDLRSIARFTTQRWGKTQAKMYISQIRDCCHQLTRTPQLGRRLSGTPVELRRFEHGSHVIFYRETEQGILIARILHQSMLPVHHAMEDSE